MALLVVHGKVHDRAHLPLQQAVLVVALLDPLADGVVVVRALGRVLELEARPGEAVHEQNEVDARAVVNDDLLHDREAVLSVLGHEVGVVVARGLLVEKGHLLPGQADAVAQCLDLRRAFGAGGLLVLSDDDVERPLAVGALERIVRVGLGVREERVEHAAVDGVLAVVVSLCLALNPVAGAHEMVDDVALEPELALRLATTHGALPSCR